MRCQWPRTPKAQTAIALTLALLVAAWTFLQVQYSYFERFYFGPHKRFPYPYASEKAADIALLTDCSLAFLVVFLGLVILQRLFTKR